jgi:hypothetical protein
VLAACGNCRRSESTILLLDSSLLRGLVLQEEARLPSDLALMENRTAHVLVFDGFADWEPASAIAELRRTFGFSVQAVGFYKA